MRKTRLVDCNPRWGVDADPESTKDRWLELDCPEGHEGCVYDVPFTPALDGTYVVGPNAGARWARTGDSFETLTLTPSIRGVPTYESREAAIADGRLAEYVHARMHCHAHFFVTNGAIEFCADSH